MSFKSVDILRVSPGYQFSNLKTKPSSINSKIDFGIVAFKEGIALIVIVLRVFLNIR